MAGIYPLSRMQQFDKDTGRPLSGAKLYLFAAGTDAPLNAYKDFGLGVLHPFPIACDSAGRLPMIFLADGSYKHRLTNKAGVIQFQDDSVPVTGPSSGGGGGTPVDPDSLFKTRDLKIRFDDQPVSGYVRLNGRTIGSAVSGATERANADTQALFTELWSFTNIAVAGGKGASAAADFSANKQLALPDLSGRLIGGRDDMGNGAQNRITAGNLGSDPTLVGAAGGEEKHTLSTSELPAAEIPVQITDPGHTHDVVIPAKNQDSAGAQNSVSKSGVADDTLSLPAAAQSHTTGITAKIAALGGGSAHNNLPPLALFTIYIRL